MKLPRPVRYVGRLVPSGFDIFPLLLVAGALLKSVIARRAILGATDLSAAFGLETATIVVLLGGIYLLTRRSRAWAVGAYAVLGLLIFANVVYISEFARPLDVTILRVAGHAGQVFDSITTLLRPSYLLFVLDIPFLVAWVFRTRSVPSPRVSSAWGCTATATVVVCALLFVIQIASVLVLPEDTNPIAVISSRGFGPAQLVSLARSVTPHEPDAKAADVDGTDAEDVQRRIERIRQAEDGERIAEFVPGAYGGKNLIVIQVETLQSMVIGARLDGQEITPNLNRLVGESWYFPNTFSQAGAGVTADAEFVANSGLYGPVTGFAAVEYADREIPALPRLLRAAGYDAVTLHQNYSWFWNRAQLYPALGFRRYYEHDFFGDRDKMWHASDQVLFEDGMKVLAELDAAPAPFYAQFITMTSHSPYRYPEDSRRPLKVPERWKRSSAANWASALSYTDKAIGEFVEDLKRQGLYDDSIIVVYGDHSGFQLSHLSEADEQVVRNIAGRRFAIVDRQRVPLVIHLPGQTAGRREEAVLGTVDLMPTLADLVGIDLTAVPHLGRSAFVGSNALVPMRAFVPPGTFVNDRVMLVPGITFDEAVAYSVADGALVEVTEVERADLERQSDLNAISDSWIHSLPRRPDAPEKMDKGFD